MRKIKHGKLAIGCADACCLKLEGLSVRLQGDSILEDVSFHLHCGEIVALIGPNGAGKSSLFRSILGQMPYKGSITFSPAGGPAIRLADGAVTGGKRPLVGYVPQAPSFDRGDPVSVLDFFTAATAKWPVWLPVPKKQRERAAACLARVHGEDLLDKPMSALSGGQLQRVLLALALEPVPHILILDEPLSGVDIEGEHQLLEMLDELRTQYDLSIFLSTHDFATLGQFADKVILLNKKVLKAGPPDEVLSSPEFYETFHLHMGKGGEA
ncbi:metal ABC transporter ATP-binding protein [Pseudoflavonifractor phocaeensis]|uniref:metal ABC transporter ATP-binding protein n=1 Tax=Pseudoflavonifractor phocaeensis TaxID=1870988 RepID=UPI001F2A553C|nr:metal ABC transporter ATP-binding protein [Pseudoflavonifractor phocaeensis]